MNDTSPSSGLFIIQQNLLMSIYLASLELPWNDTSPAAGLFIEQQTLMSTYLAVSTFAVERCIAVCRSVYFSANVLMYVY